ncbi:FGGY family carbohydrate kinase [Chitinophaga horti]|uniref:FGGY family carbohydrate kinase n=1 Tax=Chitinophaga horti TaxID=2920382 RepID=A0ABY6J2P7_9BACT|nr:FGGY family carbohydrate kinase [Chitinophaga horti]UYQ93934.1 FGGY family carbohydrate kinase [Chitinophaga horti]
MYFLGLDIGSSSIKAALLDAVSGKAVASAASTDKELPIHAPRADWAEQDPESWWQEVQKAVALLRQQQPFAPDDIKAIGIAYQMHGLVCVDKDQRPLRPSIIWCDSRAVEVGDRALQHLGEDYALQHLLNAPGNFTASKLRWVRENEPETYALIDKIMLPGDFIAMRLTGEACTTLSGLSEGIFWDFKEQAISKPLLDFYGIDESLLSKIVPTFGEQGFVTKQAAELLGIAAGTPVTYRAGDQPNNAFSLNVLQPGEAATTAGTSGVVYAVGDQPAYDAQSRVNSFIHVNHTKEQVRNGVLMCLNGTGILNSWLKHQVSGASYEEMNARAAKAPLGADGLRVYPFGNGVERILANKPFGGTFRHLNFNVHEQAHLLRAGQEGIVYALTYGIDIMRQMGLKIERVRAGKANMFLSPLFREAFANAGNVTIELYNTDGALGAARAAGIGAGYYKEMRDAFNGMECLSTITPDPTLQQAYGNVYADWKAGLEEML